MKLSNVQLRLLLPVVFQASLAEPSPEWDDMLERLIVMAMHRGESRAVEALMPGRSDMSHSPPVQVASRHPLMGGVPGGELDGELDGESV